MIEDEVTEAPPETDDPRKLVQTLNLNEALKAARLVQDHGLLDVEMREHVTGRPLLFQTTRLNWRQVYDLLGLPIPECPREELPEEVSARRRAASYGSDLSTLTEVEREALGTQVRVDDGERECVVCHETKSVRQFPTKKDRSRDVRCRACRKAGRS